MRCRAISLILSATACFSEPPPATDDGATTSDACPIGAHECACTEGDACDAPYVCHVPSHTCIEDTCERGTEFCACLDGACLGGSACIDQLCMPLPATTGTTTSDAWTSSSSDPTDASEDTIASEVGSDDAGSTTGADGACEMCLELAAPNECAGVFGSCLGDGLCTMFSSCVFETYSVEACCESHVSTKSWSAFLGCATDPVEGRCADECRGQQQTC